MTLTLADANRVIAGAIEKANQIGAKMNIAVCDAGGTLFTVCFPAGVTTAPVEDTGLVPVAATTPDGVTVPRSVCVPSGVFATLGTGVPDPKPAIAK